MTEQLDLSLLASIISPEHEAYLRWLRELYASGGIDPSFAVLQPTEV
ncbi:hypothetical protein [Paenibacillus chungangensis]|uniref:Uncharacterized protein n=1 Tax=Paenibacillus chungangensis TaxID=696535 RepID=A0ABW3HQ91_9BACL